MSERQHEESEADYDRLLNKSSEDDLRWLINEARDLFSNKSLESLRAFKRAVDRRLAAEPDKKAFSMSDLYEIRLRLWHDIADVPVSPPTAQSSREQRHFPGSTERPSLAHPQSHRCGCRSDSC
jgi:hypothetical protein